MRGVASCHVPSAAGGHEAFSCDLLPTSGNHPEWHIQADALEVVKMDWDMVIAFPPCTHLAVSGAAWYASAWSLSPHDRAVIRSKTFPGIADAMAKQWTKE